MGRAKAMRRRPWVQSYDSKRAFTRFGVVEMSKHRDPATITIDQLMTDRTLKLIAVADLTEGVQKVVASLEIEPLPELHPKPNLSAQQSCMLQIMAELETYGPFDWEVVFHHYAIINGVSLNGVAARAAMRVAECLARHGLLTLEGPLLTLEGRARLRAEEEAVMWRERLGLVEYRLERIEHSPDPNYDEIYLIKDGRRQCRYRHECFEIKASIVVLANPLYP